MVSNSADSRSFLLTICMFVPESTTNSLSSGSFVAAAGRTHFSAGEKNVVLSFALSFVIFFGKIPILALGAQLLSSSLLLRPILKFHTVGTALMRNFDLFLQAMVLCFLGYWLDVARTVCIVLVELIPKLYASGFTDISRFSEVLMALSLARHTQLWYTFFDNSYSTLVVALCVLRVTAFFRLFTWLFINLVMREQTLVPCFASRFSLREFTFGRMPIFTRRSRASTFQIISARLSENSIMVTFASDTSFLRHTLTS